ncbi:MAG: holliday junction helicase RuvA [Candidatus Parcubacteria bacterium]|jgi:Holliday junction DNA helicase RuvA|nr:holliday junction helicase RuvA [Candidatus Parcubacteria bacterium]
MISMLHGRVSHLESRYAVVDVHGVGYKVFVTEETRETLKKGAETTFWTYLAVRDDALDLFGFLSKKEKDFFELLIGVSGIGPKSAINIMSLVSSDQLVGAIRTGSTAHLVKVSGIGRKTAEKIVLELKDRLGTVVSENVSAGMSSDMDVIEALKALGYDANEARDSLKKISKDISDTGAKVKAALKILGKN